MYKFNHYVASLVTTFLASTSSGRRATHLSKFSDPNVASDSGLPTKPLRFGSSAVTQSDPMYKIQKIQKNTFFFLINLQIYRFNIRGATAPDPAIINGIGLPVAIEEAKPIPTLISLGVASITFEIKAENPLS